MQKAATTSLILAMVMFAGCTQMPDETDPSPEPELLAHTHMLQNVGPGAALDAITVQDLGFLSVGPTAYGAGEPSAWGALNGTLYVAFPGCDTGVAPFGLESEESCGHGIIMESHDHGASWTRLNRAGDGLYTDDGPQANGDADVTTDAAGNLYASNLGGGIQVHKRATNGTWSYVGDVVPDGHWADRQWMAAGDEDQLIMTWMGGPTGSDRQVGINTTFDGGQTWTGVEYFGSGIGWLGTVQFAPGNQHAYIPFTQAESSTINNLVGGEVFQMLVAITSDGGATWEVIDTGARIESTATGGHWSGVLMTPAIDVSQDGTVLIVWAQDTWPEAVDAAPAQPTSVTTSLMAIRSDDRGRNWSATAIVGDNEIIGASAVKGSPIMPWVTGGAGDRFAITYLWTQSPADTDYAGATWDARLVVVDGFGTQNESMSGLLIQPNMHQGGVCTRGGLCLLTGSDRALLDFFESDAASDGSLLIAYPTDSLEGGKRTSIRLAMTSPGTLFAPGADATMAQRDS